MNDNNRSVTKTELERFSAGVHTECYEVTDGPNGTAVLWVNEGHGTGPIQVDRESFAWLGETWTRWHSHSRHPNREAAEACKRSLETDMEGPT